MHSTNSYLHVDAKREDLESTIFPVPNKPSILSKWDVTLIRSKRDAVLAHSNEHRRPFTLSVSTFPDGAWLNVVPSSSTGTLLDKHIDKVCLHPLSCRRSVGCCPRHHDVIKRSLYTAGFPSILEPAGLSQEDGK